MLPAARSRPGLTGAVVAILIVLAAVPLVLGSGLREAGRWAASDTSTHWIPGLGDGLPYRPPAGVQPRAVQDWSPRLPAQVQVSHDFHLSDRPARPMTLFLPLVEGEARLFVNGVETEPSARPHPRYLTQPGSRAATWEVPTAFLRPGRNRIDIMVVGARNRSIGAPLLLAPNDRPVALDDAAQVDAVGADDLEGGRVGHGAEML